MRSEQGEVRCRPRLGPGCLSEGSNTGEFLNESLGQPLVSFVESTDFPNVYGWDGEWIREKSSTLDSCQQLTEFRCHVLFMGQPGEQGELLGTKAGGALGHVRPLIPSEH